MNRRTFIGAVGAALAGAGGAFAQQGAKVYRIGWLSGDSDAKTPLGAAFIAAMRELGWIEGQNFTIESLLSEHRNERFPALAAELVQRKVDLIVTTGTAAAVAAKNATTTIPIVFYYVGDAVGSGLVSSLAHPGGNITGLGGLGAGAHAKQLEFLKEAVPSAMRIGMMTNSTFQLHATYRAEVEPAARRLGVTLVPVEVRASEDIDAAFAAIARAKVDGLLILGQPFLFVARDKVAKLALEHRLPTTAVFAELAQAGVLMSYGPRLIDDFRRLPHYIDRILKGAKPGDLPVEQPTRFYLTLNLRTAKAMGLAIPQSLLLRAEEIIE